MSSRARIIASTASVSLLAAAGAGGVVLVASDFGHSSQTQTELDASTTDTLPNPVDERTTVYRAPQDTHDGADDDEYGQVQPAPPNTGFNGGQTQRAPNNTSKQS